VYDLLGVLCGCVHCQKGQQKSLAVGLYDKLSAFLGFEQNIRGPLKKCLRELASLAGVCVGGGGHIRRCSCFCLIGWARGRSVLGCTGM
jgi:hypothetical protein